MRKYFGYMGNKSYIRELQIVGLWGKYNISWKNINPDVNVLVGINGSGKTTLLNIIEAYYNRVERALKKYNCRVEGFPTNENVFPITYLRSFDNPVLDKRKAESPLMQELNNVVYQNKEGRSFFNYRMRIVDYPEQERSIRANIAELFYVINRMFADTRKTVNTSTTNTSTLVFQQDGETLRLEQLSSGEKQMLLILMKVFLLEKKPSVLLMDEPEISLHISWQQNLIAAIRTLNPNCQLILATHSPSIFAKGWADKITYIEDLYS